MRTSALLFVTSAGTLLAGVRGGCSGKVRPFAHGGRAHAGCYEVYVSCWTKLGDTCDYDFALPPWSGGYERVPDLAGDKDYYYQSYPSTGGLLALTALTGPAGGRLHCGSDDGSPQWKNYEDVVVCQKPTASPTPGPTVSPTPAPTASVPLASAAVRQALDGLCASLGAGEEECTAEVQGIMASLIAGATAEEDGDASSGEEETVEEEEGAAGDGVDIVAAAAAGLVGGTGLAAAPLLLAVAVAAAAAFFVTSRLGRGNDTSTGNGRRAYAPVPDAAGP